MYDFLLYKVFSFLYEIMCRYVQSLKGNLKGKKAALAGRAPRHLRGLESPEAARRLLRSARGLRPVLLPEVCYHPLRFNARAARNGLRRSAGQLTPPEAGYAGREGSPPPARPGEPGGRQGAAPLRLGLAPGTPAALGKKLCTEEAMRYSA